MDQCEILKESFENCLELTMGIGCENQYIEYIKCVDKQNLQKLNKCKSLCKKCNIVKKDLEKKNKITK